MAEKKIKNIKFILNASPGKIDFYCLEETEIEIRCELSKQCCDDLVNRIKGKLGDNKITVEQEKHTRIICQYTEFLLVIDSLNNLMNLTDYIESIFTQILREFSFDYCQIFHNVGCVPLLPDSMDR